MTSRSAPTRRRRSAAGPTPGCAATRCRGRGGSPRPTRSWPRTGAWLPLFGIEGQRPLDGSFFSENIEDYYCSPYELGYGRSISFGHDFLGRDALLAARDSVARTKVTLVFDPADVRAVLGEDLGYYLTYARHRVESSSSGLADLTCQTATIDPAGTICR